MNEPQPQEELFGDNESNAVYKELFTLQNEFFKGFEAPLDYQTDPYYDIDRDFRKKDYEFDSNSFLFFD